MLTDADGHRTRRSRRFDEFKTFAGQGPGALTFFVVSPSHMLHATHSRGQVLGSQILDSLASLTNMCSSSMERERKV